LPVLASALESATEEGKEGKIGDNSYGIFYGHFLGKILLNYKSKYFKANQFHR
jgi:hypothetical protein